jgi:hypothetical protein
VREGLDLAIEAVSRRPRFLSFRHLVK